MGRYYSIMLVNGATFSRSLAESAIIEEIEGFNPDTSLDKIFKALEHAEIDLHDLFDEIDGVKESNFLSEMKDFGIEKMLIDPHFSLPGMKRWYSVSEFGYPVYFGAEVDALLKEFEMALSKMRAIDHPRPDQIDDLSDAKIDADEHEWMLNILVETIVELKILMAKGYRDAAVLLAG